MPTKAQTLRHKLLLWLLLPLLILFFLRAGYTYFYAKELADRVYDRMLYTLAHSLSQQVSYDDQTGKPTLPIAAQEILLADEFDTLYFALRDVQGQIVDGESRMPQPQPAIADEHDLFFDDSINGVAVRLVSLAISSNKTEYVLQVAETLDKRSMLALEFRSGVLLPQLLIILLATLIVWFGIGKSLTPFKYLQGSVSERSHLDLSPLDERDVPAEVQPLILAINDLMARLASALEAQSRFIADAAHQLRTPLAGLKTRIELALRQDDPDSLPEQLQLLLSSTDRMTRLVNQLLALARNEPHAESAIRMQSLDLGQLAAQITRDWVPRALEKGIDLGFENADAPLTIRGDAARLKDLLDNLLDNALRYTPRLGQVTVTLTNNTHPHLIVTDNGPGIPQDQRERVFERFYSVLGNGAEGSGLGLAIVQEIARVHGADIRIASGPDGSGTTVHVLFNEH